MLKAVMQPTWAESLGHCHKPDRCHPVSQPEHKGGAAQLKCTPTLCVHAGLYTARKRFGEKMAIAFGEFLYLQCSLFTEDKFMYVLMEEIWSKTG